MVEQACALVNHKVNFANFDADGDGVVDNVFIIFAGYNEAEGGGAAPWPQSWNISSSNSISTAKRYPISPVIPSFRDRRANFAGIGSVAMNIAICWVFWICMMSTVKQKDTLPCF